MVRHEQHCEDTRETAIAFFTSIRVEFKIIDGSCIATQLRCRAGSGPPVARGPHLLPV